MNLFIDTNKYLSLYALPRTELNELERLIEIVNDRRITLWLPKQVKDEFYRNREERLLQNCQKIDELIKKYNKEESFDINIPECDERLKIKLIDTQKAIADLKDQVKLFLEEIKQDYENKIKNQSFLADMIIGRLFSSATLIALEEQIFSDALTRSKLGNPRGRAVLWGIR